jgi:hypothetical protein
MTVSTTLNKITYAGNGVTTVFPFTFPGVSAASIQVFFTEAPGNVTLLSPSAYTLILNPATGTNPTGAGGSVTYNPLGVPIPTGTFLTILRNLPLTQSTSLANQGNLYQPVEEAALDYEMMVSQQLNELQSRQLTVPVSDPPIAPLPAVAARANGVLGFDASGNPITVLTAPAGTISGAMQPVVSAASLAAGRTAFGLGNLAVTNAGTGISVLGGIAFPSFIPSVDSTPQSIGSAQHMNVRIAAVAVTYTLAQTSTLVSGFALWVQALTAPVTFVINAGDKFSGGATGASFIIPPGTQAMLTTDNAGTWFINLNGVPGLTEINNVQLNATVSGNALTISLKDRNGNDPSTASPIVLAFADPTIAGGDPVIRAITSALSITVPSTATIGTVSGQAARLWIGLFDNAGTPVLGVYNSLNSTGPSIACWDETSPATGTAIAGGSNTPQTWYTNGTVTSKSFRVLGYVEATEAVAGTWATAPSKVRLFGPGVKRPGDVVQEIASTIATGDTTASASFVALTNNRITIPIQSSANVIKVEAAGNLGYNNAGSVSLQLSRGVVANTGLLGNLAQLSRTDNTSTGNNVSPAYMFDLDIPNTAGNVTYAVQGRITAGTNFSYGGSTQMAAKEIQI